MADVSLKLLVLKTHDVDAVCRFYQSLGLTFTEERHDSGPLHYSAPLGDGLIEIYPMPFDQAVDATTRLGFAIVDPDAAVAEADQFGGRIVKFVREVQREVALGK